MNYEIKQRINNTSVPPTMYTKNSEQENELHIAMKNGSFGISLVEGEKTTILLDFQYDNISMAGFFLYLLVKNGKMGLAHIQRDYDFCEKIKYNLSKVIPCEYDIISFPKKGESFVILRKDSEKTSEFRIYFTRTGKISVSFRCIEYIDRDFIAVTDKTNTKTRIYHKDGRLLFSFDTTCMCSAFESAGGTVFAALKYDDTHELVFFEKTLCDGHEEENDDCFYKLTGKTKTIKCGSIAKPIYSSKIIRTYERPSIIGFFIESEEKYYYVNRNLNKRTKLIADSLLLVDSIKEITTNTVDSYITEINSNPDED